MEVRSGQLQEQKGVGHQKTKHFLIEFNKLATPYLEQGQACYLLKHFQNRTFNMQNLTPSKLRFYLVDAKRTQTYFIHSLSIGSV